MAATVVSTLALVVCTDNEEATGWQLTRERMANLAAALVMCEQGHGKLPQSLGDLEELGAPYFEESLLVDAWGGRMTYRLPIEESRTFRICSAGPDGIEGAGGDDACYSPSDGLVRDDD
jgi:hypothetical protein